MSLQILLTVVLLLSGGVYAAKNSSAELYPLLFPTPKKMIVLSMDKLKIADKNTAGAVIVVDKDSKRELIAAQLINTELKKLGFPELRIIDDNSPDISGEIVISVVDAGKNAFTGKLRKKHSPHLKEINTKKPQGYSIDFITTRGNQKVIILSGDDSLGTLYAAVTFYQMLEQKADGVFVKQVFVRDWPDVEWRFISDIAIAARRKSGQLGNSEKHIEEYINWLLKHKINGMKCVTTHFMNPEYFKKLVHYGRDRGVFTMVCTLSKSGPLNAVGNTKYKKLKGIPTSRRHPNFYISYVRDDLIRKRTEEDAKWIRKMGIKWVYYHAIDTGRPGNYSEWTSRSKECKRKFGDNRAAADANLVNIIQNTYEKIAPGTMLCFSFQPYHPYVIQDNYFKNEFPGIPESYKKYYLRRILKYYRDLCKLTKENIFLTVREGPKTWINEWYKMVKKPTHTYVILGDNLTLFNTRARFLKTFFLPGKENLFDIYGIRLLQGIISENIVCQVLVSEYLWNVNAPGAEMWPDDFLDFKRDLRKPEEIINNTLPRICDNIWGTEGGKYFYPLFKSEIIPQFIERPDKFCQSRVLRKGGVLKDGAEISLAYKCMNSDMFYGRNAVATMKKYMEKLNISVNDIKQWLTHCPDKNRGCYSYRYGVHLYQYATLWKAYAAIWYYYLAAEDSIKNNDKQKAENLIGEGLQAVSKGEQQVAEVMRTTRKRPNLYMSFHPLYKCLTNNYRNYIIPFKQFKNKFEKLRVNINKLASSYNIDNSTLKLLKNRKIIANKTKTPPVIDGELHDLCWQNAKWIEKFIIYNPASREIKLPMQQTRCAICYDPDFIYIGLDFSNNRKDNDRGEIFLMPKSGKKYYQFVFFRNGKSWQAEWAPGRIRNKNTAGKSWNSQWAVKTKLKSNGWEAEVKIPLKDIDFNAADKNWKVNIARERKIHDGVEWSSIQVLQDGFHDYRHFSNLKFQ